MRYDLTALGRSYYRPSYEPGSNLSFAAGRSYNHSPYIIAIPFAHGFNPAVSAPAASSAVSPPDVFQSEEKDCSICFDRLCLGGSIALGCGHRFHASCVVMLEGHQQKCPICRSGSYWPLRTELNGSVNAESCALRVLVEEKTAQNTLLKAENISLKAEASALNAAILAENRSLEDAVLLIETLQSENQRLKSDNEQQTVRLDVIRSYSFFLRAARVVVSSVRHTFYSVLFG